MYSLSKKQKHSVCAMTIKVISMRISVIFKGFLSCYAYHSIVYPLIVFGYFII